MNAANVLRLDAKVKEWKTDIKINKRPQKQLAEELGKALGFKVPVTALRDVLTANGIESKGSRLQRQVDALEEQARVYRSLLAEVLPQAPKAPDHLIGRITAALDEAERVSMTKSGTGNGA